MKSINTSVNFPDTLHADIKARAKLENLSFSSLVRKVMGDYVGSKPGPLREHSELNELSKTDKRAYDDLFRMLKSWNRHNKGCYPLEELRDYALTLSRWLSPWPKRFQLKGLTWFEKSIHKNNYTPSGAVELVQEIIPRIAMGSLISVDPPLTEEERVAIEELTEGLV